MVRVMATGVFDLIHPGHISYLEQAKALGDELIVIVACDKTVRSKKHEPITPEDIRVRVVEALKPVDKAVIGKEGDIFETVKDINPDIIVLGFDQKFNEKKLEEDLKAHGLDHIRIIRANEYADDLNATRKIVAKIRGMQ
jgi:FAD synthetase